MELLGRHGQVVEKIGLSLTSGEYRAADVLRLEDIQERYGVSRTVAREAARVLESKRMLISRPRVGLTVRPMAQWNLYDPQVIHWRLASPGREVQLRELAELRAAVEPSAAALAAKAAGEEERAALSRHADAMLRAIEEGDDGAFTAADVEFHHTLLLASGNGMFAQLSEVTAELLVSRRELLLMPEQVNLATANWHREVAESVAAGNAKHAAGCMRVIIDQARSEVEELLEPEGYELPSACTPR